MYVETLALVISDSCIHVHYNDCLKWYTCTVYVLADLFLLYILAKQYANCTTRMLLNIYTFKIMYFLLQVLIP